MSGQVSNARPQPWQYPVSQWVSRYKQGETTARIAADSGVSISTIVRYFHLAGIPLRGTKPRWRTGQ